MFTVTLDRRRKYAQRLAEQKLNTAQQLLDKIIVAFDTGDSGQLRSLLSTAKSLAQGKQLRMLLLKTLRRPRTRRMLKDRTKPLSTVSEAT